MQPFENIILPVLTSNNEDVAKKMRQLGLIASDARCNHCGAFMILVKCENLNDGEVWKCNNSICNFYKTTKSIRADSFFVDHRIAIKKCFQIIYHWSTEMSITKSVNETGISEPTTIRIYDHLRGYCSDYFMANPIRMGGKGLVCKIDETCLTHKPKYHRGKPAQKNIWAFGIVDVVSSPATGYVQLVENRDSKTLLPIISRVCRPGTIIHSDQWGAYAKIRQLGFEHYTVNHKAGFINKETGVHTQEIESYWNKLKIKLKAMKGLRRDRIQAYLYEFMWREMFNTNQFTSTLNLIKDKHHFN